MTKNTTCGICYADDIVGSDGEKALLAYHCNCGFLCCNDCFAQLISSQIESQLQSLTIKFSCPSIGVENGRAVINCEQLTVEDLLQLVGDFKEKVHKNEEDVELTCHSKSCHPHPRRVEMKELIQQSQELTKTVEYGTLK